MSGLFLIMLDEAKKGFLHIYNKQVSLSARCPHWAACRLH